MANEVAVAKEITPEAQTEAKQAEAFLELAKDYKVDSDAMYTAAGNELTKIKAQYKRLEEMRMELKRPINEAGTRIDNFFRQPKEFLVQAERKIKQSMLTYHNEQERKRRAEEARLQEIARKEQARIEKRAEAAAAKGQEEKAEALREQAETIPTPVVAAAVPKAQGVSTRKVYSAEVTDMKALVQGWLDGKVPGGIVVIDQKLLNNQARTFKESLDYPGVKLKVENSLAARAG